MFRLRFHFCVLFLRRLFFAAVLSFYPLQKGGTFSSRFLIPRLQKLSPILSSRLQMTVQAKRKGGGGSVFVS